MAHIVFEILDRTSEAMSLKAKPNVDAISDLTGELKGLVEAFDQNQIRRIQDNSSKTRLSILSYSLAWDCLKIAEQTQSLLSVFDDPFRPGQENGNSAAFDPSTLGLKGLPVTGQRLLPCGGRDRPSMAGG